MSLQNSGVQNKVMISSIDHVDRNEKLVSFDPVEFNVPFGFKSSLRIYRHYCQVERTSKYEVLFS